MTGPESRCLITGNLVGTDTWSTKPCPCRFCQEWVFSELGRLAAENERMEARLRAFARPGRFTENS